MARRSRRPRGTGHVYRPKHKAASGEAREQAVWWLAYYVGGKLVRESSGTEIKSDAEKTLRARTRAIDEGHLTDPTALRTTLDDLARFVETDYRNNGRLSSREVLRSYARLREFFKGVCLAREITSQRVEEYKSARLEQEAKPATINRELAMLRRGFRLAHRFGRVATRPDFSTLTEHNARSGFFEAEQLAAVRAKLPEYLKPLATFLFWTGWRKGEALALEWRQVDRRTGSIRIEKTKNQEPRTIPYGALPVLKELIEKQHKLTLRLERKLDRVIPNVFHRDGERIKVILTAWHTACRKAGLPGRIPHDLRRTAARNMIRSGIPQAVAMKIGGWKTDAVFRRYAIVDEKMLAENLKKLASL